MKHATDETERKSKQDAILCCCCFFFKGGAVGGGLGQSSFYFAVAAYFSSICCGLQNKNKKESDHGCDGEYVSVNVQACMYVTR